MSVTGYHIDDLGSYWQLSQKHQAVSKTVFDPLLCGDTVTVSSAIMGYFLRAEETQFGLTTELLPMVHGMARNNLDDKINWQLQCVDRHEGEQLHYNDRIRLKHQITGKYVSLDDAYAYTEANCRGCSIIGQLELHALDTADDTTIFQIKTGIAFDKDYVESE